MLIDTSNYCNPAPISAHAHIQAISTYMSDLDIDVPPMFVTNRSKNKNEIRYGGDYQRDDDEKIEFRLCTNYIAEIFTGRFKF